MKRLAGGESRMMGRRGQLISAWGICCGFKVFAGVVCSDRGLWGGGCVQLFAVDDVFQLVEQFLGAADAEGG